MQRLLGAAVVVSAVLGAVVLRAAPQDVPLETLLERLATYIDEYERTLAAVVSEEHYVQDVSGTVSSLWPSKRELKSEFMLTRINTPTEGQSGWVSFRDVFEVDGTAVQDRTDRLIQLFLKPTGDAMTQVNRIVEESAKHNLGWVRRTVNVPTMVLQFGKREEQGRSQFRRGARSKVGEHEVREVRFTERAIPRMIQTLDNAAAQGVFWIDEVTGRVHRTELRVATGATSAVIGVSYANQPELDMWLPVLMSERYTTPRQPTITGRAMYQNFRKFNVTVDTIIKK
jgi:hypothetical protein